VADAETITSVEAGVKADLFERRARVNFSVYDYDEVKNQQLTVVGGNSNVTKLINAAKTKAAAPSSISKASSAVAARDRRRQLQLHRDPRS
jgi:hypothetical protein